VTVFPATVNVPVRDARLVFFATLKLTVPAPVFDAPAVTVIHATLLLAVQPHALLVGVTVSDAEPPPRA
jgi:hypothetical protein